MVTGGKEIFGMFPEDDPGWQVWYRILLIKGIISKTCCDIDKQFSGIVLLPLMAAKEETVNPFGLEKAKSLRLEKENYSFTPIFLTDQEVIDQNSLIRSDLPNYYKKLYQDQPNLDDSIRAVYHAELLFSPPHKEKPWQSANNNKLECNLFPIFRKDENTSKDENTIENLKKFLSLWQANIASWEQVISPKVIKQGRKDFYSFFVKKIRWVNKHIYEKISADENGFPLIAEKIDKWIYYTRNEWKGQTDNGHHPIGNLFRQPVPFFFWDFCRVYAIVKKHFYYSDVDSELFKLFLLDNKDFSENNNNNNKIIKINKLFDRYKLNELFCVSQQDNKNIAGKAKNFVFDINKYNEGSIYFREKDGKIFLYRKNGGDDSGQDLEINLSQYILILLDFFLSDSENHQFLAHRFIRDYNVFKEKSNCFQTDWFFIVSEAYNDVLSYANAGSLSSFSGNTRVDFGDNPLNDKRGIVFLYKLLQLLTGRITRISGAWGKIETHFLPQKPNSSDSDTASQAKICPDYKEDAKNCPNWKECLDKGILLIHQFTAACEDEIRASQNIHELRTKKYNDLYQMAKSLENIINDFLWLPEADWAIVQRQVDFLNKKFSKHYFACEYIQQELLKRSNIY